MNRRTMNVRLLGVIAAWLALSIAVLFFPPWEFDGRYVGHASIFRTAFLQVDRERLAAEEIGLLFCAVASFGWLRSRTRR